MLIMMIGNDNQPVDMYVSLHFIMLLQRLVMTLVKDRTHYSDVIQITIKITQDPMLDI